MADDFAVRHVNVDTFILETIFISSKSARDSWSQVSICLPMQPLPIKSPCHSPEFLITLIHMSKLKARDFNAHRTVNLNLKFPF